MAADSVHHNIERELKKCGMSATFKSTLIPWRELDAKLLAWVQPTSNIGITLV